MKSVLITGAGGTAGRALAAYLSARARVTALGHADLDIAEESRVREVLERTRPEIVFNCAGYTRVDDAEREPELARKINVEGSRILARAMTQRGGRLVHLSTDYVFDGEKRTPYLPEDPIGPLSIYAQTKADSEKAVLGSGGSHLVVRVAWLFATGGKTFLSRLKDLMMREEKLRVAGDREGPCTYAPDLAAGLWALAERGEGGLYHYTNSGSCSWHGFATELLSAAKKMGLPVRTQQLERVDSASFASPARRPEYSVLDLSKTIALLGAPPRHWKDTLPDFLKEKA